MAKEIDSPEGKGYLFQKCPTCGLKLHVGATMCWKCGKSVKYNARTDKFVDEMIFGSANPNDAIYNLKVNDIDMCLVCGNTQKGKTCFPTSCFGTGKGKCDLCNRFESIRFMCCQKSQKQKISEEAYKKAIAESTQPYERRENKSA